MSCPLCSASSVPVNASGSWGNIGLHPSSVAVDGLCVEGPSLTDCEQATGCLINQSYTINIVSGFQLRLTTVFASGCGSGTSQTLTGPVVNFVTSLLVITECGCSGSLLVEFSDDGGMGWNFVGLATASCASCLG